MTLTIRPEGRSNIRFSTLPSFASCKFFTGVPTTLLALWTSPKRETGVIDALSLEMRSLSQVPSALRVETVLG